MTLFRSTHGTGAGGSIRIPSSACGTAGFKPTWGLISNDGCMPLIASMDTIGPMCRSMEECAIGMEVLAGVVAAPRLAGLRIGVLLETGAEAALAGLGAHVEDAVLPESEHLLAWFAAKAAASQSERFEADPESYSPDLRRKIESGRGLSAVAYIRAEEEAAAWRRACEQTLLHDVLVCPTIPVELPDADVDETGEVRLRCTRFTRPFNILGWASATTRDGLMWSGRDDATVLGAALAWEATLPGRAEVVEG